MVTRVTVRITGVFGLLIVLAAAVSLVLATGQSSDAQLVYVEEQRAGPEVERRVVLTDLNRGLTIPLTGPDIDVYPLFPLVWSPDGTRVAFFSWQPDPFETPLWITDTRGGEQKLAIDVVAVRRVEPTAAADFAVSIDTDRLDFPSLMLVDTADARARAYMQHDSNTTAIERDMTVQVDPDRPLRLFLIEQRTGDTRLLVDFSTARVDDGVLFGPVLTQPELWSQDMQTVIVPGVLRTEDTVTDWAVIDLNEGLVTVLENATNLRWSPSGDRLAYDALRLAPSPFIVGQLDVVGGEAMVRDLRDDVLWRLGDGRDIAWSSDGNRLIFRDSLGEWYIASADGSTVRLLRGLHEDVRRIYVPAWRP